MQTGLDDSPQNSRNRRGATIARTSAAVFALALMLTGCSGGDDGGGADSAPAASDNTDQGSAQDPSKDAPDSSNDSSAAESMSVEDQIAYGCRLTDKIKNDFPDGQAWKGARLDFGEDRVLSELMSAGSLLGGASPLGDPVNQELQDLGRDLVGAVNTLKRDEFATLVDSTIDTCKDYLSTDSSGVPSTTDTSAKGQIIYGCKLVEKTLKKYPDETSWESAPPKFGQDTALNEIMTAGSLFGGGAGGTNDPVDAGLEETGSELVKGGSQLDYEGLPTTLDQAREGCSDFDV